jgi:hypothetical protein
MAKSRRSLNVKANSDTAKAIAVRKGKVPRTTAKSTNIGRDDVFGSDYTVTSTTDGGGLLLTNVEVIVIFWGSYWSSTSPAPAVSSATYLQAFTGIVTGPYTSRLSQYRGVGPGTIIYNEIYDGSTNAPYSGYTDSDVVNLLNARFLNNPAMPQPVSGHNRFYAVVSPPGLNNSLSVDAGQHQSFVYNGVRAYYCWVDTPTGANELINNNSVTKVFSHEFVEALTNPQVDISFGSLAGNGIKANGAGISDGSNEIGDACNSQHAVIDINGVQCTVQAYWSKEDNACILPLGSLSFLISKNTFGKDEVQDAINNNGGIFSNAFWLSIDGFSINSFTSFGVSIPTVSGPLLGLSGVQVKPSPQIPGNPAPAQPFPVYEDPSDSNTVQRIRYSFDIIFTDTSSFPSSGNAEHLLNTTFQIGGTTVPGIHSQDSVNFEFVSGADPYFSNIDPANNSAVSYLSQDLRVFTITQGTSALPGDSSAPLFSSSQTAHEYLQQLLGYLNSASAYTTPITNSFSDPLNGLPGQSGYETGESSVTPLDGTGHKNYNFAIARVRLRSDVQGSASQAADVRVFFRLWVAPSYDTDFQPYTTYVSSPGYPSLPASPLPSSASLPPDPSGTAIQTTPFFATDNGTNDYNNSFTSPNINNNIQTIQIPTIPGRDSVWAYYGCYLDVYNSSNNSTYPGTHHCIVAQIAYDETPINYSTSFTTYPGNSDKLAQRNLQITLSGNPGPVSTHRIPQAFDTRPSSPFRNATGSLQYIPDELMIDWGNTPAGSIANIYWPQVNAADVLQLASEIYNTHLLSAYDMNTITCKAVKGATYIPIPEGTGKQFAGLFTVDLPLGVTKGQLFKITVRRLTTRRLPTNTRMNADLNSGKGNFTNWRYVSGAFEIKIPVTTEAIMLPSDENTLAIMKWRLENMTPEYRWYPVLKRYIAHLSGRIDGSGGNASDIKPSQTGLQITKTPTKYNEYIGKVCEVIYNCFGNFEGFILCTCCSERKHLKSKDKSVGDLILLACKERLQISVFVNKKDDNEICKIIIHC